ncbi:MAG: tRNA uridine-5-carboxymethylaminomethyl(34) synthesis GTPase MnmE [Sphingomonadales bacterium]|nr:tRNA uridine-5-carboxymethylaminomethyl(34) synthesis GTPase MnmE [Sphingomonadales bacterium]
MNRASDGTTIVALASPQGLGAVALIRLSGSSSAQIVSSLCRAEESVVPQLDRRARLWRLYDGGELLDESVVTGFAGPRSYTGEDVVELGVHASPYIIERVLRLCLKAGARMAEPGEFTLRAFLNGRLDLSQAEAVADLIAADSPAAHRMAVHQMRGGLSERIGRFREQLIDLAALLELELDFSEEDVAFADRTTLRGLLVDVRAELASLRAGYRAGQMAREGVATVIAGRPNAGKSTLLNALLGEEKAIVSPIPGTTRDVVEDVLQIGGVKFRLLDTAGLRVTADSVEQMGVDRTRDRMQRAALVLFVFDPAHHHSPQQVHEELEGLHTGDAMVLPVANKCDVPENRLRIDEPEWRSALPNLLVISGLTGDGLSELRSALRDMVDALGLSSEVLVAHLRHDELLGRADTELKKVELGMESGLPTELLAAHLRAALRHLGEITGAVDADDLLGAIFSRFCIGK